MASAPDTWLPRLTERNRWMIDTYNHQGLLNFAIGPVQSGAGDLGCWKSPVRLLFHPPRLAPIRLFSMLREVQSLLFLLFRYP